MKFRRRVPMGVSRDYFSWALDRVHKFNRRIKPMRGGYRL